MPIEKAPKASVVGTKEGPQASAVNALLFSAMFFATWGSGLQILRAFDLPKIFPVLAGLLVIYTALFVKNRIVFPRAFTWFIAFYLLHMAVTYGVFYQEEFVLSYYFGGAGVG